MDIDAYRAELAAAMEAGFRENINTGEGCHGLADAYMATFGESTLREDIGACKEYNRWVEMSLNTDTYRSAGEVAATFNYIRVKAVRVAMKVALRRGETEAHWTLH
ncbi:hypothetical protein B1A87_003175 [Arthrobacter sp. KBS0703]|uniref:hypothetical protein n=1 Tax=Arthrobacter sp. KBS0703 TaxID=1955698 RepID=UPI00098F248F|nr:hypothetical protein [Arthrobacter sp. KBS0703]TSE15065.1 hypothetical protein B1A87_003175 [Arthrobacter sp. KBS0703]